MMSKAERYLNKRKPSEIDLVFETIGYCEATRAVVSEIGFATDKNSTRLLFVC